MVPVAEVVHETGGRVRVKIASRKKDAAYFTALAQKLEEHQKLETVHVNPRLGTALISHTSSVAEIAQYAEKERLFQLRTIERSPQTIFQRVHKVATGWSRALENVTGGRLDVPSLISPHIGNFRNLSSQ